MNALNETRRTAAARPRSCGRTTTRRTAGIVIAGAGRSFVAGADIRFFIRNIERQRARRASAKFTETCRRCCSRFRTARSRSSRACTASRSAAASSSRSPATTSSPRRTRASDFPRPASASIPASAARNGRRAGSARASRSGWCSPDRSSAPTRRWRSASSTPSRRARTLDAAVATLIAGRPVS